MVSEQEALEVSEDQAGAVVPVDSVVHRVLNQVQLMEHLPQVDLVDQVLVALEDQVVSEVLELVVLEDSEVLVDLEGLVDSEVLVVKVQLLDLVFQDHQDQAHYMVPQVPEGSEAHPVVLEVLVDLEDQDPVVSEDLKVVVVLED